MPRMKKSTKVALVSDIHGNLPAFEAVLDDAGREGAGDVWNLGDMLGYAPFPNEVIQKLRDIGAVNIVGNYDLKVLAFGSKQAEWKRKKPPAKYAAFQWNHTRLQDKNRALLQSLAPQIRRRVNGLDVLLVHGSPASIDELLGSDTSAQRFVELAEVARADVVVCGHSHEPFVRCVGQTWFVNPGSVGRPEGGDWRASYAILEFVGGGLKVDHRRVAYDIDRVVRAIHAAGLPKDFIDVFRKAKSLDQLEDPGDGPRERSKKRSQVVLDAVLAVAQSCQYEREHTHHVTKLALEMFDALKELHRMGSRERFWLQCGALLHDIGWTEGQQGHHRTARRLILADPRLPFERRERTLVALIARYHRKALPNAEDKYFGRLTPADQRRVRVLAGILRVADGLDRGHRSVTQSLRCKVSARRIAIVCDVTGTAEAELIAAQKKADLLEQAFSRPVVIELSKKSP